MKPVIHFIQKLERHVLKSWYPIAIAFFACIDLFVFIIPTDALLITSVIAAPRRWITLAAFTTAGFIIGCFIFMMLVYYHGLTVVHTFFPGIETHELWAKSEHWMADHGLLAIFVVSLLPIALHPILAIAVLSRMSIPSILLILLVGRVFKYGLFSWLASHAPNVLAKFRFERKEIDKILERDK